MSLPEYIEQYRERAVVSLAGPFWGKPRVTSLLVALVGRLQDLEDDTFEVMTARTLEEADLVRLKVLGKIIGQPRLGFDLETYRTVLRAAALANVSRGRASDILAVLDVLLGAGQYILLEAGNATLFLSILNPISALELKTLQVVLPNVRAAGVGFQVLTTGDPDVFIWGDPWGPPKVWGSVIVI